MPDDKSLPDDPEDPRVRAIVRDLGATFGNNLYHLLGKSVEIVVIARPEGTGRCYFVTNTEDAVGMMDGFKRRMQA